MNVRVLLVTRFRELSMRVTASNRDALTIVHVAWLSDAIRRLKQNDFQAVMVDLDLPDAKGLEALHAPVGVAPHLPLLVLGDDTVLEQMKMVEHGAHDYLLKHRLDADALMRALHGSIARKAGEGVLFSDKKSAQLTIDSIGDGILSTDNAGLVTFLNPVAEKLMGWTYAEAAGRHLLEGFQVIEATTCERVVPRLESKLQKGRTMILPPNCLLVRRDGHESPIEDYAAPIYDRSNHISGMVVVFHEVTDLVSWVPRSAATRFAGENGSPGSKERDVDRCRIVSPRHYRATRFHQSCRSAGQVVFGFRSTFCRYSPRAYQRTVFYDDRPTERQWTPLGPTDPGRYTNPSGSRCLTGNSRAFEKP